MSKDWRSGLQSRLKDVETKVEDLVDGALQSDEIACDTLDATTIITADIRLSGVGGNVLEVGDGEADPVAVIQNTGDGVLKSLAVGPYGDPVGSITDTGVVNATAVECSGTVAGVTIQGHVIDPNFVTPVNAVLATGGQLAYQNGVNVTAGKKVTIPNGDETDSIYTFVETVAVAGDVKVGADADASMLNLSRAINKSGGTEGAGQDYLVTAAHPLVTAAHNAGGDLVTFTVQTRGEIGNIDITTDEATITPTDPTGGVDGTVGAKGDVRIDADAIYVCTAANTITGQNWKRATLGALA